MCALGRFVLLRADRRLSLARSPYRACLMARSSASEVWPKAVASSVAAADAAATMRFSMSS